MAMTIRFVACVLAAATAGATELKQHGVDEDVTLRVTLPLGVGDVNGDGIDDLVYVGSGAAASTPAFSLQIVFGRPCWEEEVEFPPHDFDATVLVDRSTVPLAVPSMDGLKVGDLNGDGIGDITFNSAGETRIVFGRAAWPRESDLTGGREDVLILASRTGGLILSNAWAKPIADVNGDGIGDVLLGSGTSETGRPVARAFFGRPSWPARWDVAVTPADLTVLPPLLTAYSIPSIAAGDVNGDGIPDVLFADPYGRLQACSCGFTGATGAVHVLYNRGPWPPEIDLERTAPDVTIYGPCPDECPFHPADTYFGSTLTVADLTGDGIAEVVVGATRFSVAGGPYSGALFLLEGSPSWPATLDLAVTPPLTLIAGTDHLGTNYLGIPTADVNADGIQDLVVYESRLGPRPGWLYNFAARVYHGGRAWPAYIDIETDWGELAIVGARSHLVGPSALLGDFNGGGIMDFVNNWTPDPSDWTKIRTSIFLGEGGGSTAPTFPATASCGGLGQGFWHRQCMSPGIPGPLAERAPYHPRYPKEELEALLALAQAWLDCRQLTPDICDMLDADPASDRCEKARKRFGALLLNVASGNLGEDCALEAPVTLPDGQVAVTVGDVLRLAVPLLKAGGDDACRSVDDMTKRAPEASPFSLLPSGRPVASPGMPAAPLHPTGTVPAATPRTDPGDMATP